MFTSISAIVKWLIFALSSGILFRNFAQANHASPAAKISGIIVVAVTVLTFVIDLTQPDSNPIVAAITQRKQALTPAGATAKQTSEAESDPERKARRNQHQSCANNSETGKDEGGQNQLQKWGVNLIAVKQEWYANRKAAEFARQCVFAKVIPIQGKDSPMYRLRVGGFKSKVEALANADRIKTALKLDSVWVSDN